MRQLIISEYLQYLIAEVINLEPDQTERRLCLKTEHAADYGAFCFLEEIIYEKN